MVDCTWIAIGICIIAAAVVPVVNLAFSGYRRKRLEKFQRDVNSDE